MSRNVKTFTAISFFPADAGDSELEFTNRPLMRNTPNNLSYS